MTSISVEKDEVDGHHLFPLSLVPIEQFMLWDDTLHYPKRFRVILDVEGDLDRGMLEHSIQIAAMRHPLLLVRLDDSGKQLRWKLPSEPAIPFRWLEGMWDCSPFPDEWRLHDESGVRIYTSQSGPNQYHITFDVHHAVSDGLGMRQFVADIIIIYDHLHAGKDWAPELLKLKPERLTQRGHFVRPAPTEVSRPTTLWEKIAQAYSFHFRGPATLSKSNPGVPLENEPLGQRDCSKKLSGTLDACKSRRVSNACKVPDTFLKRSEVQDSVLAHQRTLNNHNAPRHIYRRVVLDVEQKKAWERSMLPNSPDVASNEDPGRRPQPYANDEQRGSNLNDLILGRFFEVLAEWNCEHGRASERQRLRIMIPTDLRTFHDGRLPAANRFGFGFVVSDISSCSERSLLLRQVAMQVAAIQRYSLGLDFVEIFGGLARFPELARCIVNIPRCMATGVLTNLGDLSRRHRRSLQNASHVIRIGDLELKCVTCFPPLRPKTYVGVGVCATRESFSIGLILDAQSFSTEDAETMLEKIAAR